jgi:hypothetical protein
VQQHRQVRELKWIIVSMWVYGGGCSGGVVDLLCVASLTSASAATSSLLAPSWAGAGAGAGAEAGTGCGAAGSGALLAGVTSGFTGSGAVAGAGAGAVSVVAGSVTGAALDGLSIVGVGSGCSSFLAFFLEKRPLKAFFIWSMASGAGKSCVSKVVSWELQSRARDHAADPNACVYLRTPGMMMISRGVKCGSDWEGRCKGHKCCTVH